MEHEIKRFQKLTYDELIHLRGIYQNRIADINKQLRKFVDGEEVSTKTYDIMVRLGYQSNLLRDECEIISEKICKIWKDICGNIGTDLLPYAITSSILDFYNYEYNPHDLIDEYDIDKDKFYRLYLKIKEYLNENYWKR